MSKPQKLPSGKWRIRYLDSAGKRKSETFASVTAAKAALRRHEVGVDNIRAGLARPLSDQTLREAHGAWLDSRRPAPGAPIHIARLRNNRVRDNERHLRDHILPELGDLHLAEITDEVVQAFVQRLEAKPTARKGEKNEGGARTLKPGTIATVIITLRKMMRDLKYPISVKYEAIEGDYAWIRSAADVSRLLDACDPPWFRMACELAVYAGLRLGEVAGLRWDRVDFDIGAIRIDRSYEGPPKSKHVRTVPMAPDLAARLKRWRMATGAASKGLVVTIDGEPIGERTDMGKRVRRACRKAKIEPVTFHQLRHTCASFLAKRISLPEVGAVLGHIDPKTTARYAHHDTDALARDPRLHLSFEAPSATVTPIGDGHQVDTLAGPAPMAAAK